MRLKLVFLCFVVPFFISGPVRSDSLEGLVTRYTTDCPAQEKVELSLRFQEMTMDVNESVSILDRNLDLIDKILNKTNKISYEIQNTNFNITPSSQNERMVPDKSTSAWVGSGSINLKLKSRGDAQKSFALLTEAGFVASLSIQSMQQERCKQQ